MIVRFEPPSKKTDIPQWMRCQEFRHLKNYCHKTAVYLYVKCAGKYLCANCGGNYPVNYKGCEVHKQLQQKLFQKLRNKEAANTVNQNNRFTCSGMRRKGASHAQGTTESSQISLLTRQIYPHYLTTILILQIRNWKLRWLILYQK